MVREHKSGSRPVECEKAEDEEEGGEADKGTCPKGIEEEEEEGGKEDVEEDEPELRRGDRFVKFGGLSFIIESKCAFLLFLLFLLFPNAMGISRHFLCDCRALYLYQIFNLRNVGIL